MNPVRTILLMAVTPALLLAQGVDRTHPPQLPSPPALHLPPVQTARLPNGLEIAVVEKHEVPVVDVSLLIGAGSVRDPADLPGLATFTAAVLQEGAGVPPRHPHRGCHRTRLAHADGWKGYRG